MIAATIIASLCLSGKYACSRQGLQGVGQKSPQSLQVLNIERKYIKFVFFKNVLKQNAYKSATSGT